VICSGVRQQQGRQGCPSFQEGSSNGIGNVMVVLDSAVCLALEVYRTCSACNTASARCHLRQLQLLVQCTHPIHDNLPCGCSLVSLLACSWLAHQMSLGADRNPVLADPHAWQTIHT
jgi:hypothetical protein